MSFPNFVAFIRETGPGASVGANGVSATNGVSGAGGRGLLLSDDAGGVGPSDGLEGPPQAQAQRTPASVSNGGPAMAPPVDAPPAASTPAAAAAGAVPQAEIQEAMWVEQQRETEEARYGYSSEGIVRNSEN